MIGKVTKGNNFTGLLSYVLDKPGAKYIGASQLSGEHSSQWAAQFMRVAAKRRRTEYPVAHYSFSPPPNQPMADETAYRYAQKFCQRMGHENCQWLLVRHTDTKTENGEDRDHFHLVVNRVSIDGSRTVSSFNDWYRSQAAHRELSEEFELHRVPSVWETDRRNPSTGQIRRVRRQNREYAEGKRSTPADPIILTELQDRIDKFCQDRPNLTELVRRLRADGVTVRIQPDSNGGLGISYRLGAVAVAGSSLGRAYTVKGLQQWRGISYHPVYHNPVLKLFLKDQWYEWPYVDNSENRPRIREKPTLPEPTPNHQLPPQKPKSPQPELSPASTSRPRSKPDLLNEEEYRQWSQEVAPVIDAYLNYRGISVIEAYHFRTYRQGQDLVLEHQDDNRTLMIACKTEKGSWETPNCFPIERSIAKHILERSVPSMQRIMRAPDAGSQQSKPDLLNEEEYRQWSQEVAPVIDAYLNYRGISVIEAYHFRTYRQGQDIVLEQQHPSKTLMIACKTEKGSWETPNCFPVERSFAKYILERPVPSMQRIIRPPDAGSQLSPGDVLNRQDYQEWVNTVAPVLFAYFQHHKTPTFEGKRFNAYRHFQSVSLEQRHNSQILMMARKTSEGSWEPDTCYSVEYATAKYILSEFLPAMRLHNPSIEVNSSSTPTPKSSESPVAAPSSTPPTKAAQSPASTPSPTPTPTPPPKAAQSPVATPSPTPPLKAAQSPATTPTPTPKPTQDPPDILNEQEYQQWVNTVAPSLNTYLKHRGGRMVEGDRFRTYKRGQYLVLEYLDGSDTLILGRPTGKGSWETPDPVPFKVKREDANYILERSIPLMQRRMSQDKKRARQKKRSRSRQLDISD